MKSQKLAAISIIASLLLSAPGPLCFEALAAGFSARKAGGRRARVLRLASPSRVGSGRRELSVSKLKPPKLPGHGKPASPESYRPGASARPLRPAPAAVKSGNALSQNIGRRMLRFQRFLRGLQRSGNSSAKAEVDRLTDEAFFGVLPASGAKDWEGVWPQDGRKRAPDSSRPSASSRGAFSSPPQSPRSPPRLHTPAPRGRGDAGAKPPEGLIRRSMFIAGSLGILKFGAGLATHSSGIMASALDSFLDLIASAVNYFSMKMSRRKATAAYAYGYGKIEGLAGLLQSALIGVSGAAIVFEAARRMLSGAEISAPAAGMGVMALTAAVSLFHGLRLKRAALAEKSNILKAEAAHFEMDALTNLGVLFALLMVRWQGRIVWDLLATIAIAGYVAAQVYPIFRSSLDELLDKGPKGIQRNIGAILRARHPKIAGFDRFRARASGKKYFIEFRLRLRGVEKLEEAARVAASAREEIQSKYPDADVAVLF
ncbi:MAG: cation diffusion facilitator family transporter [Elusimicrobia bacterium]|nr:cation diffusion facilitator family transporter [Elusimicrobiota bacterium]